MMKKVIVQKEVMVKKCNKCDEYGRLEVPNDPTNLKSGSYYPFCNCEFGKWEEQHQTDNDMFSRGRGNKI